MKDVAGYGGVVLGAALCMGDPEKLPFPLSRMPASDARDWDAIHAWAEEVYGKLSVTVPA